MKSPPQHAMTKHFIMRFRSKTGKDGEERKKRGEELNEREGAKS